MEPLLTRYQESILHRRDVLLSLDLAIPTDLEAALAAEGLVDIQTTTKDTING